MKNRIYKVAAVAIVAGLISLLGYYERHGIRLPPDGMDRANAMLAENLSGAAVSYQPEGSKRGQQ